MSEDNFKNAIITECMTRYSITQEEAERILIFQQKLFLKGCLSSSLLENASTPSTSSSSSSSSSSTTTTTTSTTSTSSTTLKKQNWESIFLEFDFLIKFLYALDFNIEKSVMRYLAFTNHFGSEIGSGVEIQSSINNTTTTTTGNDQNSNNNNNNNNNSNENNKTNENNNTTNSNPTTTQQQQQQQQQQQPPTKKSTQKTFAVDVMDALKEGVVILPGTKDTAGNALLVLESHLMHSKLSYSAIVELLVYLLDLATKDVTIARKGITAIVDLSSLNWRSFDVSLQTHLLNTIEEKYPVKLNNVFLVNPPMWISLILKAYKALMPASLAAKTEAVDYNALTKFVPQTSLTPSLGGPLPYNHNQFIEARVSLEADILASARREGYLWQLITNSGAIEAIEVEHQKSQLERQLLQAQTELTPNDLAPESFSSLPPVENLEESDSTHRKLSSSNSSDDSLLLSTPIKGGDTSNYSSAASTPSLHVYPESPVSFATSSSSSSSSFSSVSSSVTSSPLRPVSTASTGSTGSNSSSSGRWVKRYFVTQQQEMIISVYNSSDDAVVLETIDLHNCEDIVIDEKPPNSAPFPPNNIGATTPLSSSSSKSSIQSTSRGTFVTNPADLDTYRTQYCGFTIIGQDNQHWVLKVDNPKEFDGWVAALRGKMQIVREERKRKQEEGNRRAVAERELKERLENEAREAEERRLEAVRLAKEERIRTLHPKRTNIVQELLATEKSYVNNLLMVIDLFLKPLRAAVDAGKPIVGNVDLKKIFPDLESIVSVNKQLMADLSDRVDNWSPTQKIGDVFLNMAVYLKVYTGFVSNFPIATDTVNKLAESSTAFKNFLKETEAKPECKRLGLLQHLLTPIQRIPRYVMLLEDLGKRTDPDHVDYQDIMSAVKQMKELANFINETKREAESRALMVSIQKDVKKLPEGFVLVNPIRKLIVSESFTQLEIASGTRTYAPSHTILIYLFSDIALVVKRKKKKATNVDSFKAKANISDVAVVPLPDAGETTNIFQLTVDNYVGILQAPSKKIRDDWIAQLKENQQKLQSAA